MSTLADAINDETAAQNKATDALNAAADLLRNKANAAQTVISGFVTRPQVKFYYVDANNGSDANDGLTAAKAFKTVDYAITNRDQSVLGILNLMTDAVIARYHAIYSPILISGITPGLNGAADGLALRKLSWLTEAADSPYANVGRSMPYLDIFGGLLRFLSVQLAIPTPAAGVVGKTMIQTFGTGVSVDTCTLTADAVDSGVNLFRCVGNQRSTFTFNNSTIGTNVPGKIFAGVAAGGDPRTVFAYETNLATA